jgi:LPS O-antigen subunit length determinant protein (WzzB/FepE family)
VVLGAAAIRALQQQAENMTRLRGEQKDHAPPAAEAESRALRAAESADPARNVMTGPPSGYFLLLSPERTEDTINLGTLIRILAGAWKTLALISVTCALIAAGLSLTMRDWYRSEVLIAPVTHDSLERLGMLQNELGGLAAMAGVELAGGGGGRKVEAFATLTSSGFAREFITSENLMPILFADRWDPNTRNWRAGKKPPTLEAGVKQFTAGVRKITQDRKTQLVTVSVQWYSPQLAAAWANRTVDMVNDRLRTVAINQTDRSIEYLNKELAKADTVEMQHAIYRVIEDQVKRAMLANVEREYAFRVIDPAVPAEKKAGPHRAIITLIGAVIGFFIGTIVVSIRRTRRSPLQTSGGSAVDTEDRPE